MSGSSTLVSWLLRQGLLDQLDLLVFPVVLGSGKRLFSEPDGQVPMTLAGSAGVRHRRRPPHLPSSRGRRRENRVTSRRARLPWPP